MENIISCVSGYLTNNITGFIDGQYMEVFYQNTSCGSVGCAYNNIMCNSPANLASSDVLLSAGIFLAAAVIFFFLGKHVNVDLSRFKAIQYLYLFISFVLFMQGIIMIGGVNTLTPNAYTDAAMLNYMIILGTGALTVFVTLFTEFEIWIKDLEKAGKSI